MRLLKTVFQRIRSDPDSAGGKQRKCICTDRCTEDSIHTFQYRRYEDTGDSSGIYDQSSQFGTGKEDAGVFEDLIRVSVGIEDIEDLKADFAQAIEKIGAL